MDVPSAETRTTWMPDAGRMLATVVARQRGVRRFSAWLAAKEITGQDRVSGLKPPSPGGESLDLGPVGGVPHKHALCQLRIRSRVVAFVDNEATAHHQGSVSWK